MTMDHGHWARGIEVENPGRISPRMAELVLRYLLPIVRLFHRPTLEGVENLPKTGAFLLVANHSAGMGIAEILCILALYVRDIGPDRPLAAFALPLGFRVFPLKVALRHLGAVPSSYAAAKQTLAAGVPLLVFPGGDHETLRPIWQAHRVDLGGRLGFLRIARETNVPIVPLGIRGSHFTAPMLLRSRLLATLLVVPRLIGSKRWGISLLGLLGALGIALAPLPLPLRIALIWVWLGSPLVFAPWIPWTIRLRIGAPLAPETLFPNGDAPLEPALARVQDAMQTLVAKRATTH